MAQTTPNQADAEARAKQRASLKATFPDLPDQAIEKMLKDAIAAAPMSPAASAPKFKEPPRYKLLEKAYLSGIRLQQGNDWVSLDDVLLDPEEQPVTTQLSGVYGGRGSVERRPIIIEYLGIPDEHMEPLNPAAEWMFEHIDELMAKARAERKVGGRGRKRGNPIDALSIIGPDPIAKAA